MKIYRCATCLEDFDTPEDLHEHYAEAHPEIFAEMRDEGAGQYSLKSVPRHKSGPAQPFERRALKTGSGGESDRELVSWFIGFQGPMMLDSEWGSDDRRKVRAMLKEKLTHRHEGMA